jgi:hypothetical protein
LVPEGTKGRARFLLSGKLMSKMAAGKNEEALVTMLFPNAG